MNHQDHINLIRDAITEPGGHWADFGSGDGAFTLALRDLLGNDAEIFSIEKDNSRLDAQRRIFRDKFPNSNIHFMLDDFTHSLNLSLSSLDGIVMANSLHFFRNKISILHLVRAYLKREGRLILVEYNVDSGNHWVPHPLSFETFRALAPHAGFAEPKLLATRPSHFLREIYCAVAVRTQRSNHSRAS